MDDGGFFIKCQSERGCHMVADTSAKKMILHLVFITLFIPFQKQNKITAFLIASHKQFKVQSFINTVAESSTPMNIIKSQKHSVNICMHVILI